MEYDEKKKQKGAVNEYRHKALLGVAISALILATIPHSHPQINIGPTFALVRIIAYVWGWISVVRYLIAPWLISRKWNQL